MICHIHFFVVFQSDGKEKEVALQYIPGVMGPPGPQVTVNCCYIIITTPLCISHLKPLYLFIFLWRGLRGDLDYRWDFDSWWCKIHVAKL